MAGGIGSVSYLQNLANSSPFEAPIDYRRSPLGSVAGEEGLASPYNLVAQDARVQVRNWSGLIKRNVLKDSVSATRGGVVACETKGSPFYGKSPEDLRRIVKEEGRDMNWYAQEVKPLVFRVRFDGKPYEISPALYDVDGNVVPYDAAPSALGGAEPRWHNVPAGAWDLYMGNYERMRSSDFQEKTREMEAVQSRGLSKYVIQADNPFGLLEFKREEIVATPTAIDRDRISSTELLEV